MFKIKRNLIQRIYYLGSVIILLSTAAIISFPFFTYLRSEHIRKIDQLTEGIIEQRKRYLEAVIIEKISDIKQLRQSLIDEYTAMSEAAAELAAVSGGSVPGTAFKDFKYNVSDGEAPDIDYAVGSTKDLGSRSFITAYLPEEEEFDRIFRENVIALIWNTELPEDGYIWINEIHDFQGGDNYALRLVHPNLPETEGMLLSTKDTDIKGNLPYLAELEGIRKDGAVFYDYYFKKMNSDLISHKLSYGRLYKPYNWVVATGVYLDDLDQLIQVERDRLDDVYKQEVVFIVITILFATVISIMTMLLFEKRINNIITSYTDELQGVYASIEKMAYVDFLTGLWNRRGMNNQIEAEISRSQREGRSFCIIMADVDFFKVINDNYGHDCGDYILCELAAVMKKEIRTEDLLSRWGGEEFLFLINSASAEQGRKVAEKIRRAIEAHSFEYKKRLIKVTITFGVSEFTRNDDIAQVIAAADRNLYTGKERSRNCVVG